jgi:hypothetical protein
LSAPYVGHGVAELVGGGPVGRVAVVVGTGGGGVVVDCVRGRLLPHETRVPVAAITARAARLRRVTGL